MVMQPPWSSPDPAIVTPPKKATKRATPRKPAAKAPVDVELTPAAAPAPKRSAKKAPAAAAPAEPVPAAPTPPPSPPSRPARVLGITEAAALAELRAAKKERTVFGAGALLAARTADEASNAGNASGTAAALREMRQQLALAKATENPLSPSEAEEAAGERVSGDDTVVQPGRLVKLRERAEKAAVKSGKRGRS
jgi:hypothetical protein